MGRAGNLPLAMDGFPWLQTKPSFLATLMAQLQLVNVKAR